MSEIDIGVEHVEPDGYLQPRKYKIICRCLRCGKEYSFVTARLTEKNRPCPRKKCREAADAARIRLEAENLARMLASQQPPAQVGANPAVKAVDVTANVVMQDYKLTDLKDSIREGESMAPKLPPKQQDEADNFFTGNAIAKRTGIPARQLNRFAHRAMAGAFKSTAINPTELIGGKRGEPILRRVEK